MYEISEKYKDMAGNWRIRVGVGNNETIFLKFKVEPTENEIKMEVDKFLRARVAETNLVEAVTEKQLKLWAAENRFIDFCRSLGLPDKADSSQIEQFAMQLKANGRFMEAIEMSIKALALINDVTQNGGKWETISYHNLNVAPAPVEEPVVPVVEEPVVPETPPTEEPTPEPEPEIPYVPPYPPLPPEDNS